MMHGKPHKKTSQDHIKQAAGCENASRFPLSKIICFLSVDCSLLTTVNSKEAHLTSVSTGPLLTHL